MNTRHSPDTIASPFSQYSHGVQAPASARWLHVSGQVGNRPDGGIPEGVGAQTARAFDNIKAILGDAGMDMNDVVKVTVYLTCDDAEAISAYREARDEAQGDALPASTLVVVTALAHPDWLVEIEAVAARS